MSFKLGFSSSKDTYQMKKAIFNQQIFSQDRTIDINISEKDYFNQMLNMDQGLLRNISQFSGNIATNQESEDDNATQNHFLSSSSPSSACPDDIDDNECIQQVNPHNWIKLLKDKNIIRIIINKFFKFLTQTQEYLNAEGYHKNELCRQKTNYKKKIKQNKNRFCCLKDLENVFGLKLGSKDPEIRSKMARRIAYEIYNSLAVQDELKEVKKISQKKGIGKSKELFKLKKNIFNLKIFKLRCRSQKLISRIQIV